MPSFHNESSYREKPWLARVQLNNRVYNLGYHQLKGSAIIEEERFKSELLDITNEAHSLWRKKMNGLPY